MQPERAPEKLQKAAQAGAVADRPPERRILAMAGEVRRVGQWLVPQLLRVRAFLGEVKVDLRGNIIPEDFTLDVRAYGSRVTLIVPPGMNVIFDVFSFMGNAINQAHEAATNPGQPVIRVVGSAYLGEVRVLVREVEG